MITTALVLSTLLWVHKVENVQGQIEVNSVEPPVQISSEGVSAIKFVKLLDVDEDSQTADMVATIQLVTGAIHETDLEVERFFPNARSLDILSQEKDNNGTTSVKVKIVVDCEMHFQLYPFDSHSCMLAVLPAVASSTEEVPPAPATPRANGLAGAVTMVDFCGELKSSEYRVRAYLSLPPVALAALNKTKLSDKNRAQFIYLLLRRTTTISIYSQTYTPLMMLVMLSFFTMLAAIPLPIRIGCSLALLLCSLVITSLFYMNIPRSGQGDLSVLEHYFALSIAFLFQSFFANILLYWYSCRAAKHASSQSSSERAAGCNGVASTKDTHDLEATMISDASEKCLSSTDNLDRVETSADPEMNALDKYILTLGKFHQYNYFKGLKVAKKNMPIFFVIINLIYWPIVLYLSSYLPKGFQALSATTATIPDMTCL